MANLYGFNPRTRKGCDVNKTKLMIDIRVSIHAPVKDATHSLELRHRPKNVSIHAPVKDATGDTPSATLTPDGFNPRTRKGCDSVSLSTSSATDRFQSTHP